ncbi:hypothetical protein M8494_12885 [Serratia ureilytica]
MPDKEMLGLNIVEFAGDDRAADRRPDGNPVSTAGRIDRAAAGRRDRLPDLWRSGGHQRIYNMRKKAAGLLGNAKGRAKPIPFAEDTCVPPQHLADYIVEFRQLLDDHNLSYGMFGHVDAGVLHVRRRLICDPQQEVLMKQISDRVVALTAKYGGLL